MFRIPLLAVAAVCTWTVAGGTPASGSGYPTPDTAAEAAFIELLPEWNVVGVCNTDLEPAAVDVCFRFTPGRSTAGYSIYSAHTVAVTDAAWWAGVIAVDDGWKAYGGGRCDEFYCRIASPDDEVLVGLPNGDVDCDGSANSRDALLILQVVAELLARDAVACIGGANVYPPDDISSTDALSILQSDAGLIGALPAVVGRKQAGEFRPAGIQSFML